MAKNEHSGKTNPQPQTNPGFQQKPSGASHQEGTQHQGTQNQGTQHQGSQSTPHQGTQHQGSSHQGSQHQGSSHQGSQHQGSSASHQATGMAEQARDTLGNLADKGQEALQGARESVATLPERASGAVASQMKTAADQLRERVPQEGVLGSAAHTVADRLESGADYLKEHDLREMADDVAGIVRSYPIPAVLAGIGIGFLLGRTLRS